MNILKASWKTTVGGVVVFLSLLFGEIEKAFDDDPKTAINFNVIVEAAGLLFVALSARDNDVTSEKAGAS